MQVFANQPLRSPPHFAILSSDKVGDFVIATPLLRGLKEKYPNCIIDFFGSEITRNFEIHCPYVDWRFSLHSRETDFLENFIKVIEARLKIAGLYDLAINCDEFNSLNLNALTLLNPDYVVGGTPHFADSRDPVQLILRDLNWNDPALVQRYPELLQSNYISEIFCRIAYVETDFFRLEVPSQTPTFTVPDVLISIVASRPAKMWRVDYWKQTINWCESEGLSIGLVGSNPSIQQTVYHSDRAEEYLLDLTALIDLRGKTSLTELAGALSLARACLTIDTGILHIAAAVGCPTVAILGNDVNGNGASPLRLWLPRQPNVCLALSDFTCTVCQENRFQNQSCLVDEHPCMRDLSPQQVIELLQGILKQGSGVNQ